MVSDTGNGKRRPAGTTRHARAKLAGLVASWAFTVGSLILVLSARWGQLASYLEPLAVTLALICAAVVASLAIYVVWGRVVSRGVRLRRLTRAFLGTFAVGFTLTGGVFFYYGATYLPFLRYSSAPYLTWANGQDPATAITVCWRTPTASASVVDYGTDPDTLTTRVTGAPITLETVGGSAVPGEYVPASAPGTFHHVALEDLAPGTTYYYRVPGHPVKAFTTAPADGAGSFTWCVWSDPRTNNDYFTARGQPNLPATMAEHVAEQGTPMAFSVCCGDITARGIDLDTWRVWLDDITTADFASNHSHQVAIGNHARHEDRTGQAMHLFYPYQSFNYSFTYQQLHVVVMDPWDVEAGWWGEIPPDQFAWLEADLAAHAAVPFKVICVHPSPIVNADFNTRFFANVSYLATRYGVDVVFSGHTHQYEVSRLNGTYYFVIGIGGNHNHGAYRQRAPDLFDAGGEHLAGAGEEYGYCQVDVTPESLRVRPRLINGTWLADYAIPASAN